MSWVPALSLCSRGARAATLTSSLSGPILSVKAIHSQVMTVTIGTPCVSKGAPKSPGEVAWRGADIFSEQPFLLAAINSSGLFVDPKSTVDLPLLKNRDEALDAFASLHKDMNHGSVPPDSMCDFVAKHFAAVGSDLLEHVPCDFKPLPTPQSFLPSLPTGCLAREWAVKVNALWAILGRSISPDVRLSPSRHTLLPLPYPFIIAGDRFREAYYWDSYWIIRGLITSGMLHTSRHMVDNLLWMLDNYGFVPNGSRTYYLNRSQPPLLSCMVRELYGASHDRGLLESALPLLRKEHSYFTRGRKVVHVRDAHGQIRELSRYYAHWEEPRPESHSQDTESAAHLEPDEARQLYRETASAAESGWDFSSRWFPDGGGMSNLHTTSVVPADLNAFLFQMEENIAWVARELGDAEVAREFEGWAAARREAIDAILWNEDKAHWVDLLLEESEQEAVHCPRNDCTRDGSQVIVYKGAQREKGSYASDYIPVWCGLLRHKGSKTAKRVLESLRSSGLICPGGVAASNVTSGQQWDFPNAWPPLQAMVVEGLESMELEEASAMAEDVAHRFLLNAHRVFKDTGYMSEKYDARVIGGIGRGGEYEPQVGFGWTNGVVLMFLERYGSSSTLAELHGAVALSAS